MLSARLLFIGVTLVVALSMAPFELSHGVQNHKNVSADRSDRTGASQSSENPRAEGIGPTLIEANPEAGFEYPYYLYAPKPQRDAPTPILVEPNNSPRPSDDFAVHIQEVETKIEHGVGRHISDELAVPLVLPVFPRPVSEPVDWTHSIQQLDLETMNIEAGPLKRIDLQLLRMVEDARERLKGADYEIDDGIMLNGFSASGIFANRFAALHPEKVVSVTAGGINGMPVLPYKEIERNPIEDANTYPLTYHVGVANVEKLTGVPFDRSAFRDVPQYLYIGENDNNDTLLYPDTFTGTELRLAALLAYGDRIHEERFPRAKAAYEEMGAKAVFRMYEDAGHTPKPVISDLVEFHRRILEGEAIETVRADLGGNVPEAADPLRLRQ